MSFLTRNFVRGLLTLVPISLSLYFLYWFFSQTEQLLQGFLFWLWPQVPYRTGMGITFGLILIFSTGLLMSNWHVQKLFSAVEMPFNKVPLVKSIYSAIKDLMGYFSPGESKARQVVLVKFPDISLELIGFLTRKDLTSLPHGVEKEGRVAVYLPLSYQIGGMTVFIPEAWVTPVEMSVEVAMRSALTAWMPGEERKSPGGS